jgi:hypothetical protein
MLGNAFMTRLFVAGAPSPGLGRGTVARGARLDGFDAGDDSATRRRLQAGGDAQERHAAVLVHCDPMPRIS